MDLAPRLGLWIVDPQRAEAETEHHQPPDVHTISGVLLMLCVRGSVAVEKKRKSNVIIGTDYNIEYKSHVMIAC